MNEMAKNLVLWIIIAVILLTVFNNFNPPPDRGAMTYSQFVESVRRGEVERVIMAEDGYTIKGTLRSQEVFETIRPNIPDLQLIDELLEYNVQIEGRKPEQQSLWAQLLVASFPILVIIAVFMFFMRQMQGGSGGRGGPMSFGKSKARLHGEGQIKTTFADVAGVEEAKEEVKEIVEFLRDPSRFKRLGGRIPRGVLMVGSPGTGKTLLAKAIAGEANVAFFAISGSDFVEMFVGVGASRVRDMFDQAKKHAPCLIFIDEIDAVGRHRGAGLGGGHDEREQTLNQLLVEMDGFEINDGVIVIAATNRPDVLDPALLRPGRFDRQVVVPLPDLRGREQILRVHMRKVACDEDVNAGVIARGTPGMSGADLANVVNEAALFAARAHKPLVNMEDFELAKDKILMGAERKSMVMSDKEKRNTAYHEAGHVIVGRLVPGHDPVYKVSIIPRGRALGVTMFLPEEDRYSLSKQTINSQICGLYGGRIAEQLILGEEGITTGASNDIKRATDLAHNMVTRWGLSTLGPMMYEDDDGEVFLGRSYSTNSRPVAPDTADKIDNEVKRILDECYETAHTLLTDNIEKLHIMAEALVQFETLDSDQIDDIMSGKKPRPPEGFGGGDGGQTAKNQAEEGVDTKAGTDEKTPEDDPSKGHIGGPASEH